MILPKNPFKRVHLNTYYLKRFRSEANSYYQVWKKDDGYYVAMDVIYYNGKLYAEETINFGNNLNSAKHQCDIIRRNYIINQVKRLKAQKTIY